MIQYTEALELTLLAASTYDTNDYDPLDNVSTSVLEEVKLQQEIKSRLTLKIGFKPITSPCHLRAAN